jgi:hypothetical protein
LKPLLASEESYSRTRVWPGVADGFEASVGNVPDSFGECSRRAAKVPSSMA